MKTRLLLSVGFAITAMLTSCLSEPDFEPVAEGSIQIKVSGSINQLQTKVNAQGFEDGDALGLYAVNYENSNQTPGTLQDEGNQADHVKYVFDESNSKWNSVHPVYYKDENTNVDIYAFYPYAEPSSVTAYNFEVQKDQSIVKSNNKLGGYEASDFLWGKSENVVPTEAAVKVRLSHKMAGVYVVLEEGTGFEEAGDFDLLDKKILVTGTTRKASINLCDGTVSPIGDAQSTGIVMAPQSDGSFRAVVVPQPVDAGVKLFAITIGGVNYSFSKSENYEYKSGKLSKFTIKVNRKYPSGEYELILADTQIIDWKEDINTYEGEARQYYCVHCEEPGTLDSLIKTDKKNPDKIKNLKVSGNINIADFYFMRDSMAILQSVNLKEASVKASAGVYCDFNGKRYFKVFDGYFNTADEVWSKLKMLYPDCDVHGHFGPYMCGDDEIPPSALDNKSTLVNFVFPEVVHKIGGHAFYQCSLLTGALIIPNDVKEICRAAFFKCSNLSSVSLPEGLVTIEGQAFEECNSLSSLLLPSTLKYIGECAFSGCHGIVGNLLLPDGLEFLGNGAFGDCHRLTGDLKIPESITTLYSYTFGNCGFNGRLIMHDNLKLSDDFAPNNSHGVWGHGPFYNCGFQGELVLPSTITKIPKSCFTGNQFSTIAAFPDDILEIGDHAFMECQRLMGTIELPQSLISLGSNAFTHCCQIQGLILPSDLGVIKTGAFQNCYQLNNIVCKSLNPPVIQSSAFDGVPKDNFTVEVPSGSVKLYQSDSNWKEFMRIAAHYDFSLDRSRCRALNSSKTQTCVLRAPANYSWSLDSKPEWITVTPTSGTGKAEISIIYDEMAESEVGEIYVPRYHDYGDYDRDDVFAGREGEIVFKLDDVEEYTVSLEVEQFDYDHQDGDVIQLHKATQGKGVNIVFMGDCYDAKDIASEAYINDIYEAYGHFFSVEPYKSYKDYFNVYAVFGESTDSGVGTVNTVRDAKFGSQYSLSGISPDFGICYEYAAKADPDLNMSQTLIVMIENTTEYGGICYMWGDGSAVACCPKSADAYPYDFRGIVQHEAGGHGFGKLADEYIYHNTFIQSCPCACCNHVEELEAYKSLGWYKNIELTGDINEVGWSHMIFDSKYSNYVDVFEGGYFHARGVYRSEATSCMNNNIPYFSAISRQAIVERIMDYAGEEFDMSSFYEKDNDDMGPTTKSSIYDLNMPAINSGKQHAPVYMGDRPDFL